MTKFNQTQIDTLAKYLSAHSVELSVYSDGTGLTVQSIYGGIANYSGRLVDLRYSMFDGFYAGTTGTEVGVDRLQQLVNEAATIQAVLNHLSVLGFKVKQ